MSNISDEELALVYNGATASFTPSSYEGFGLPLIEAMACGTPVVTCRNSSLEEIGKDAVIYIDEPLEKSTVMIMDSFENNQVQTNSLIQRERMRAREFNWEICAQDYIQLYRQLLWQ